MASLDILCFNHFNLKNKILKIEYTKIFRGPSKALKNISWPINICLKYLMGPTKTLLPPSYILNVLSLNGKIVAVWCFTPTSLLFYNVSKDFFHFKKFSLKWVNMTKTFRLNYTLNVSCFWKLPLILLKMLSRGFLKNVMSTESFSVAPDAVSINIFQGDYSKLMHSNKCNGTAIQSI